MRKFNLLLTDSYVKEETESADKEGHLEDYMKMRESQAGIRLQDI